MTHLTDRPRPRAIEPEKLSEARADDMGWRGAVLQAFGIAATVLIGLWVPIGLGALSWSHGIEGRFAADEQRVARLEVRADNIERISQDQANALNGIRDALTRVGDQLAGIRETLANKADRSRQQ